MRRIEKIIKDLVSQAAVKHWNVTLEEEHIQVQKTRKEFEGDFTLVVFPLLRHSKINPEQTGNLLGDYLVNSSGPIENYKGQISG